MKTRWRRLCEEARAARKARKEHEHEEREFLSSYQDQPSRRETFFGKLTDVYKQPKDKR
jgi:hypothetical protein